ncbi:hypothetical protein R1sor_024440 [Riccia sorocarpa]|uniref:Uncharacterized protein n=1 Tax=Riccia sorocarpa TaxID=122646 RepID=A0ABD3GWK7_9MARC
MEFTLDLIFIFKISSVIVWQYDDLLPLDEGLRARPHPQLQSWHERLALEREFLALEPEAETGAGAAEAVARYCNRIASMTGSRTLRRQERLALEREFLALEPEAETGAGAGGWGWRWSGTFLVRESNLQGGPSTPASLASRYLS